MLVEEAYDRDFQVNLITDCCSALTEDIQDFTIEDLHITREGIKFLTSNKF
jgi:nicotinamidase-related amidase